MKRSRQILAIGALLVSGALVLGGCGGSGGKSKRLTKAEFAAKANALCADYTKKTDALGSPKTSAEAVTLLGKYKTLFQQVVADTKKLKPPVDEQASVDRIMTIADQQLPIVDQMITALKKGDQAEFSKLTKTGDAMDKESNKLFRQLGATECTK